MASSKEIETRNLLPRPSCFDRIHLSTFASRLARASKAPRSLLSPIGSLGRGLFRRFRRTSADGWQHEAEPRARITRFRIQRSRLGPRCELSDMRGIYQHR